MSEDKDEVRHIVQHEEFAARPKWRIENKTGRAIDTHIFSPDGVEVREITRIEIEPIVPGGIVKARITVLATVDMMMDAEQKLLNRASADIMREADSHALTPSV